MGCDAPSFEARPVHLCGNPLARSVAAAARRAVAMLFQGVMLLLLLTGYVITVSWSRPGSDWLPRWRATNASAIFAAALGMVVTCIYLLGLLERRDRTVFRMGYDSMAVLVTYSMGLVGLYYLR